nr:photoreceptor outer segment membrane glycoprotein 2-like [Lytechinus pictus]
MKQAVFPCHISEECRQRLISFLIIQIIIGIVCGTLVIGVGFYIRSHIRAKVNLIEGYDFEQLPITLMVVGGITVLMNPVVAKIGHEASFSWKREKLRSALLAMVVILCIVDLGLLIGGSMTFIHGHSLKKSFHNGLTSAMKRYKDDIEIKEEIDSLQLDFGCCGNEDYEDWFRIQWINDDYIEGSKRPARDSHHDDEHDDDGGTESTEFLNDDTPFSCCHPRSIRPCIHHNVLDNDAHYLYNFDLSFTIHKTGCKHRLMEYFNRKLNIIGGCVMGLCGLQLSILLTAQYLNSSICNALDRGNPERTAKGWIFEEFPLVTLFKAITAMILGAVI